MAYLLFLDDKRNPWKTITLADLKKYDRVLVARGVRQACMIFDRHGLPAKMYLDHDLGDGQDTMRFLKYLVYEFTGIIPQDFAYVVMSSNPEGRDNIISYIDSWIKSRGGKGERRNC